MLEINATIHINVRNQQGNRRYQTAFPLRYWRSAGVKSVLPLASHVEHTSSCRLFMVIMSQRLQRKPKHGHVHVHVIGTEMR